MAENDYARYKPVSRMYVERTRPDAKGRKSTGGDTIQGSVSRHAKSADPAHGAQRSPVHKPGQRRMLRKKIRPQVIAHPQIPGGQVALMYELGSTRAARRRIRCATDSEPAADWRCGSRSGYSVEVNVELAETVYVEVWRLASATPRGRIREHVVLCHPMGSRRPERMSRRSRVCCEDRGRRRCESALVLESLRAIWVRCGLSYGRGKMSDRRHESIAVHARPFGGRYLTHGRCPRFTGRWWTE